MTVVYQEDIDPNTSSGKEFLGKVAGVLGARKANPEIVKCYATGKMASGREYDVEVKKIVATFDYT